MLVLCVKLFDIYIYYDWAVTGKILVLFQSGVEQSWNEMDDWMFSGSERSVVGQELTGSCSGARQDPSGVRSPDKPNYKQVH